MDELSRVKRKRRNSAIQYLVASVAIVIIVVINILLNTQYIFIMPLLAIVCFGASIYYFVSKPSQKDVNKLLKSANTARANGESKKAANLEKRAISLSNALNLSE